MFLNVFKKYIHVHLLQKIFCFDWFLEGIEQNEFKDKNYIRLVISISERRPIASNPDELNIKLFKTKLKVIIL